MNDADNLIAIHKRLKSGKGRRIEELALNRAVVVVTVAAWQAYVQDIARTAIDGLRPPLPPLQAWNLVNAQATRAIQLFSTPNAEKTQELLLHTGFDPLPHWIWTVGPEHLTPSQTAERMNRWLKVRHSIAHGHDELPDVPMLAKTASGERSLRRANAEACMTFFRRVVRVTDEAIRAHLG